jgi:hypothetical protein
VTSGHGPGALVSCSTFSRHASTRLRLPMCSVSTLIMVLREGLEPSTSAL